MVTHTSADAAASTTDSAKRDGLVGVGGPIKCKDAGSGNAAVCTLGIGDCSDSGSAWTKVSIAAFKEQTQCNLLCAEHRPIEWHRMAWCGMAWHGVAWRGVAWCGMLWRGMSCC